VFSNQGTKEKPVLVWMNDLLHGSWWGC